MCKGDSWCQTALCADCLGRAWLQRQRWTTRNETMMRIASNDDIIATHRLSDIPLIPQKFCYRRLWAHHYTQHHSVLPFIAVQRLLQRTNNNNNEQCLSTVTRVRYFHALWYLKHLHLLIISVLGDANGGSSPNRSRTQSWVSRKSEEKCERVVGWGSRDKTRSSLLSNTVLFLQ